MEEIKILQEFDNQLLKRIEAKIIVKSLITPKMTEVAEFLTKKYSTGEENIKIQGVKGKFGRETFLILANIYKSKEEKHKTELRHKQKSTIQAK